MAMGKKTTLEVELHPDMVQMLEHARELYGFRSTSKALRVILDYVAVDADWEKIFMSQRCLRCGAGKGWERPAPSQPATCSAQAQGVGNNDERAR